MSVRTERDVMTTMKPFPHVRASSTPPSAASSQPPVRFVGATTTFVWRQSIAILVMGLFIWMAYKVATGKYYTPRSNFGFYLGVGGSVSMVALLAYPLRKHVRAMQRWGALKHWFRWHMILGIVGPLLILFHSTFHLRSLNATIALVSMLIVVISGVVGRFVYTKIHHGLYGSRATLEQVRQEFLGQCEGVQSRLHMAPRVERWLELFGQIANQPNHSLFSMCRQLLVLAWKRPVYEVRCAIELRKRLRHQQWPEFPGGSMEAIRLVKRYLRQAERVATFVAYERLFSLWHVLHIPLIYLLAASGVVHVIAVYMY